MVYMVMPLRFLDSLKHLKLLSKLHWFRKESFINIINFAFVIRSYPPYHLKVHAIYVLFSFYPSMVDLYI